MRLSARRVLLLAAIISTAFVVFRQLAKGIYQSSGISTESRTWQECGHDDFHRIDSLMERASSRATDLISRKINNVTSGAAAYRERRGRHPPPGFDIWYNRALEDDVFVTEEFFDQIYDDLEPFWGIEPSQIRASVESWPSDVLKIRNGKVIRVPKGSRFRTRAWARMLGEVANVLPDITIAINPLDEPRAFVPWEQVNILMNSARSQREHTKIQPLSSYSNKFERPNSSAIAPQSQTILVQRHHGEGLKAACRPWSALSDPSENDIAATHLNSRLPRFTKFIENTTLAQDVCRRPDLHGQHGFLLQPTTLSYTTSMIPLFSAAKLQANNDILLPEPAYYHDEYGLFSDQDLWPRWKKYRTWKEKFHGLIWRGAATGGSVRVSTWEHFHRHRFVSALNATKPSPQHDSDEEDRGDAFEAWLSESSDAAFTKLPCEPDVNGERCCTAMAQHFEIAPPIRMREQYGWKYLPDIDGNSLSGRFRAFLLSDSAPMKATLFREWHDNRLVPWQHFIPIDLSFRDLYDVMRYFLGGQGHCAHDEAGQRIARAGRRWAQTVLRKEDMIAYVHRVLLEYARIVDDRRDSLGYVKDLQEAGRTGASIWNRGG